MGVSSHLFGTPNKRTQGYRAVRYVRTHLPPATTLDLLLEVAKAYPSKSKVFEGTWKASVRDVRRGEIRSITTEWGQPGQPLRQGWTLLAVDRGGYAWFQVTEGRMKNGELVDRKELDRLVDMWFAKLQQLDPDAMPMLYEG